MATTFYDYVRGKTDEIPEGYSEKGLNVYRYLVFLGASQMIESCYPELKNHLGEDDWTALIQAFVKQSAWTSHFYGDLEHEFNVFLANTISEQE